MAKRQSCKSLLAFISRLFCLFPSLSFSICELKWKRSKAERISSNDRYKRVIYHIRIIMIINFVGCSLICHHYGRLSTLSSFLLLFFSIVQTPIAIFYADFNKCACVVVEARWRLQVAPKITNEASKYFAKICSEGYRRVTVMSNEPWLWYYGGKQLQLGKQFDRLNEQ